MKSMVNYEEFRTTFSGIVKDLTGETVSEREALDILNKVRERMFDFLWDCGNIQEFEEFIQRIIVRKEFPEILEKEDEITSNLIIYVVDDYETVGKQTYGLYHDHVLVIPAIYFNRVSEIAKRFMRESAGSL